MIEYFLEYSFFFIKKKNKREKYKCVLEQEEWKQTSCLLQDHVLLTQLLSLLSST